MSETQHLIDELLNAPRPVRRFVIGHQKYAAFYKVGPSWVDVPTSAERHDSPIALEVVGAALADAASNLSPRQDITPEPTMTDTQEAERLLGCPFCGNELRRKSGRINPMARCTTDGCIVAAKMSVINLDDPVDVARWNTRTPHVTADREAVARIIDPIPFEQKSRGWPLTEGMCATRKMEALDKADAILSLTSTAVGRGEDSLWLDWLEGSIVDTIYLDDGKLIDVRGGDLRKMIDIAKEKWPQSLEDDDGDVKEVAPPPNTTGG